MSSDPTPSEQIESHTKSRFEGVGSFLRRRFVLGVAFGILFTAAFVFFNDGQQVLHTLHGFEWGLVPLILLLSLSNYLLRFVKWHLYLRWVEAAPIAKMTSLVIFFSGLSMAITPGKVGEFLKPYLVRRANGTPLAVTAPIVVSERITDGVAMLVLASLGLLQVRNGWIVLVVMAILFVAFAVLLQRQALVRSIMHRFERIALIGKRIETLETLYESTWRMFRPGRLLFAVGHKHVVVGRRVRGVLLRLERARFHCRLASALRGNVEPGHCHDDRCRNAAPRGSWSSGTERDRVADPLHGERDHRSRDGSDGYVADPLRDVLVRHPARTRRAPDKRVVFDPSECQRTIAQPGLKLRLTTRVRQHK